MQKSFKLIVTNTSLVAQWIWIKGERAEQHKSRNIQIGRHRTSRKSVHYHLMCQCASMPVAKCSHGLVYADLVPTDTKKYCCRFIQLYMNVPM